MRAESKTLGIQVSNSSLSPVWRHCWGGWRHYESPCLKAIPQGLALLIKSHLSYNLPNFTPLSSEIILNGINIIDKKCDNKHIRKSLQQRDRIAPRGKFFWNPLVKDIIWKKAWLLPHKYCITNKIKETHFKILHKIYPTNVFISKYTDLSSSCSFCNNEDETLVHLFFDCNIVKRFLADLSFYLFSQQDPYVFSLKDIFFYYENSSDPSFEFLVNFFLLHAKFFIHKQKWKKMQPLFMIFTLEMSSLLNSLKLVNNKKNDRLLNIL